MLPKNSQNKNNELQEILVFFENFEPPQTELRISCCEVIVNQKKFIKSHISAVKANSGKKTFLPYYLRLKKVYDVYNSI